MKRLQTSGPGLALAVVLFSLPGAAHAQLSTLRGTVVDAQGQPVPGVVIQMEFKGERRVDVTKTLKTDKKGGYVRAGLGAGPWHMKFEKEGFVTFETDTNVSLGGISELPPVVMQKAAAPAPAVSLPPAAVPKDAQPDVAAELQAEFSKALAAVRDDRQDEAQTLLTDLVAKAPEVAPAHYWLGQVLLAKHDVAGAEAALRKARELDPADLKTLLSLAAILSESGRGDQGLALLEEGRAQHSEQAEFQFMLGITAINAGLEKTARPALEKAVELDPSLHEAYFNLATLAIGQNDVPAAIGHLETYLELAPASAENVAVARTLLTTLKERSKKK